MYVGLYDIALLEYPLTNHYENWRVYLFGEGFNSILECNIWSCDRVIGY